MDKKQVAVFKNKLFLYSETFIKEQVESMAGDNCYYLSTMSVEKVEMTYKKSGFLFLVVALSQTY